MMSLVENPTDLARTLALLKAEAVYKRNPDAVVLGSDQLGVFEERVLGKPGSREGALRQLASMVGKPLRLVTAVAVFVPGEDPHEILVESRLRMRPLSPEELESYVDFDRPFNCAGSFKIESGGIALFDEIDTEDMTAVIGLPLIQLSGLLRRLGFSIWQSDQAPVAN